MECRRSGYEEGENNGVHVTEVRDVSVREQQRLSERTLLIGGALVLIAYVLFASTGHVLRGGYSFPERWIGIMFLTAFRPIGLLIPFSVAVFMPLSPKGRLFAAGLVTAIGIALTQYFVALFLVSMAAWLGVFGGILITIGGIKAYRSARGIQ